MKIHKTFMDEKIKMRLNIIYWILMIGFAAELILIGLKINITLIFLIISILTIKILILKN